MSGVSLGAGRTARTGAAVDAAAQAEFNEKKWVWVPDAATGYLAGWVVKEEDGGETSVVSLSDGQVSAPVPYFCSYMRAYMCT